MHSQVSPSSSHYIPQAMQSPMEQHGFQYSAASPPMLAPPHPVANHPSMRETEYPASETSTRSNSIAAYSPYAGPAQSQMASQLSTPPQPQSQQPQTYSPPQPYPTSESDANYWRQMFRELGIADGNMDSGGYPPLNGIASTMPDIGMSNGIMSGTGNSGYHEPHGSSHVNGHGSHGPAYANHPNRHYQPYPQPTYNSHSSHSGYNGLVPR